MPNLTDAQVRHFAERGYVLLPGLVSSADAASARSEADRITAEAPPPAGTVGPWFSWPGPADAPVLWGIPAQPGGILSAAGELTAPGGACVAFGQTQIALSIPPFPHRPGRPHIDGYREGQPPGTFTMLAGLLLTEQVGDNCGNLWVWPGTHLAHAAFFAQRGAGAFADAGGYPDVDLPEPVQVHGSPGDVLLAHYLLGHNIGGNYESSQTRVALYWRLRSPGHGDRWEDCLTDPWLEYAGVRRRRAA